MEGRTTNTAPDPEGEIDAFIQRHGSPEAAVRAALGEAAVARARAEAAEARLDRIAAAVADYLFSVTVADGRVVSTAHAPGCLAVTGHTPEDFARDPFLWLRMVPEADHGLVMGQAQAILMRGEAPVIEHRILHRDGRERWVRNQPVLWRDARGALVGYDGLVRDITGEKRAAMERDALIAELQAALSRVRALSGLLPICSGCKSIRNDRGYWEQVEHYIEAHSDAHFSHGLCPGCMARLYPDHVAKTDARPARD